MFILPPINISSCAAMRKGDAVQIFLLFSFLDFFYSGNPIPMRLLVIRSSIFRFVHCVPLHLALCVIGRRDTDLELYYVILAPCALYEVNYEFF